MRNTSIPKSSSTTKKAGRCAPKPPLPIPTTLPSDASCAICPPCGRSAFQPTVRLLNVQTLSHDCSIGKEKFNAVIRPIVKDKQRASALPFGDPRVLALMQALCLFELLPEGFRNADLRCKVAELLNQVPRRIHKVE